MLTKVLSAPLVLLLFIAISPFIALVGVAWTVGAIMVCLLVTLAWITRGVRFLVVYSDSEQWKPYFEGNVISGLGTSARVINLSRDGGRKRWWHLDWAVYQFCGGMRSRFPIVLRFRAFGPWQCVRFYDAYLEAKKGKPGALNEAKARVQRWNHKNA